MSHVYAILLYFTLPAKKSYYTGRLYSIMNPPYCSLPSLCQALAAASQYGEKMMVSYHLSVAS
jgi:hypothetical protein